VNTAILAFIRNVEENRFAGCKQNENNMLVKFKKEKK